LSLVYTIDTKFNDKNELGNKGANLVNMVNLGLPVPPAFVVSISAWREWEKTKRLPEKDIDEALANLEKKMGRKMGAGLEVSVRSSGPVSMPGMMDTVLNIGDRQKMLDAIIKVFASWNSPRAIEYRRLNKIPGDLGTSAIIQAMVYGNKDSKSATGVLFSRNPSTGEQGLWGEYLMNAQGEDIVSGARTPEPVSDLKKSMPQAYAELDNISKKLEQHFRDMQDMEFTIETGKVYMLQTRNGKRTGPAAIKVAVDMVHEKLITEEQAIKRISVEDIQGLLHKRIKDPQEHKPLTRGLNAAPGAGYGKVVFTAEDAVAWAEKGRDVILVRPDTSPDDIHGIAVAVGVLTQKGGLTSHAAVVTRAMGKPSVCGAEGISTDLKAKLFKVGDVTVKEGDEITIDGTSGNVYLGKLLLVEGGVTPELREVIDMADKFRKLGVRTNADTPEMMLQAKAFGADGVGLCRTERMFNAPASLAAMREFILAENPEKRTRALNNLRELQTRDFIAIFKALDGLPIIIRLLDMPLHEFLPHEAEAESSTVKQIIAELREINPMLGHRGVRLAITNPELYQMQMEAITKAMSEVPAHVSIMIPQVMGPEEIVRVKKLLDIDKLKIKFGIMVETVGAAMSAGPLAEIVDFFSFGTNDLTQATLSFSREDAEKKFLPQYLKLGILKQNPFEVLDKDRVVKVMDIAVKGGRGSKAKLEIGVCGEQGGEPTSIRYVNAIGVNYVSCSPFRIPVAKLVAAKIALEAKSDKPEEKD
jgi:pyruvate, orthophosphate dikinase